jgi:hypothetical protein
MFQILPNTNSHELFDYMQQLRAQVAAEYDRIRRRARFDPGTAGDEGEETWAEVLRGWLPPSYPVVTKGQIISADGELSPQVDVLVLDPSYPPSLTHKKKYFAAAVAAAFECKLTLESRHIARALSVGKAIKTLEHGGEGTPYLELCRQPLFGLLAHSHSLRSTGETAIARIDSALCKADKVAVSHPREMLDVLCIADLAVWRATKHPYTPRTELRDLGREDIKDAGRPTTSYMCEWGRRTRHFTPLFALIEVLLTQLAWQNERLRPLASYFVGVNRASSRHGRVRVWPLSIYSAALRKKIIKRRFGDVVDWNHWAPTIE